MKKVTKKAIKAAPKYMVTVDYKASYKPITIEGVIIEAETLAEAMAKANELFDEETVCCLSLYEKTEEVDKYSQTCILYKETLQSFEPEMWRALRKGQDVYYWGYCPDGNYTACIKCDYRAAQ